MGSNRKQNVSYGESPTGQKFWYVKVAKRLGRKPVKIAVKKKPSKKKAS